MINDENHMHVWKNQEAHTYISGEKNEADYAKGSKNEKDHMALFIHSFIQQMCGKH